MTCPCGAPLSGAYLCATCVHALDVALADIAAHWTDLDNVRAKLTRYGGAGAQGDRLPIDPRFAAWLWVDIDGEWRRQIPGGTALLDAVRNTVTTWVRVVQEQWPTAVRNNATLVTLATPSDTVPACCMWLLGWTGRIRIAEWGPQMLDEMTHLAQRLEALVDRPADRWYAGPCDQCRRDLYARTGAAEVTCPECQLDYDVAARREWLLKAAEDQLVTAATLSRAVSWLGGMPLSQDRIRKWAERGRIVTKPADGLGPLYRVGDALALLAAERQKVG